MLKAKALLALFIFTSFLEACPNILNHKINLLDSQESLNLCEFEDSTLLVVNVASRCGFTNQYAGLQKLYEKYKDKNFTIIGIPSRDFYQEFSDESKVAEFCSTTYGVNFPMLKTSSVRGENAHPFYKSLSVASGTSPTWNFNKYLVSKNGIDVKFYSSGVRPDSPELLNAIEEDINS